jgi:sugar (pentulose or hexulose) kinase
MNFLGLDLGTSSIKGAILDLDARVVGRVRQLPFPAPTEGLPPHFHEVGLERVISVVKSIIAELNEEARECSGIVMCGQMGGLIFTNTRGEALSNYISWQDKRPMQPLRSGKVSVFEQLTNILTNDDWNALGREVRPGLPISLLYWLKEVEKLPTSESVAACLPDFVAGHLCGCTPAMHFSGAVGSLNISTGVWHHELFSRLGLGQLSWPRLVDFREPVGLFDAGRGGLPIYAPVGDHQCSLLGAGLRPEELSLNISTGSQVSMLMEKPDPGQYQLRPYFEGRWLKTITNLPAGRALNVLVRLVGEIAESNGSQSDLWKRVSDAAEKISETDLRVNLSFYPTPVGDRGVISNIREDNFTVGHLFQAALSDMARNYYTCALRLSQVQAWRRLLLSGGLSQKLEVLRIVIAKRFEREYRLCSTTEDSLEGLLRLALIIAGKADAASLFAGP